MDRLILTTLGRVLDGLALLTLESGHAGAQKRSPRSLLVDGEPRALDRAARAPRRRFSRSPRHPGPTHTSAPGFTDRWERGKKMVSVVEQSL